MIGHPIHMMDTMTMTAVTPPMTAVTPPMTAVTPIPSKESFANCADIIVIIIATLVDERDGNSTHEAN